MKKYVGILFIILASLIFTGCSRKPSPYYAQVSNKPAQSSVRYSSAAVTAHPHHVAPNIHWQCTVADHFHTWQAEAATLLKAQSKAKNLCEQMSAGRSICRYRGCVQVES